MTDQELHDLLTRCERGEPQEGDLGALGALLDGQEAEVGWVRARASLCAGLADERVEVAEGAVAAAGLGAWAPVGVVEALGAGLRAESAGLDLADDVLAALDLAASEDLALSALIDGELAEEQRRAVAARLGTDEAARRFVNDLARVGQVLRQGLAREVAAHGPPAIWPAVSAGIDLAEEPAWAGALASGIREEAGTIDVADLVMRQILPAEERRPAAAPAAVRPAAIHWTRRLPVLALVGSAAALLLVLQFVGPDGTPPQDPAVPAPAEPTFEVASVNDTEIEDLEVAENAMVQVFQLDEGSPMVIFIDEGTGGDAAQEVTL